MSKLLELELRPDERTLRQFGFIALVGFGALAACAFWEVGPFAFGLGRALAPVTLGLGALALLCAGASIVYPKANRAVYVAMSVLAYPIGLVVSYAVLALLFFAVLAPIGAILRLFGHDPMQRRLRPDQASYFSPARPRRPRQSYFRQF